MFPQKMNKDIKKKIKIEDAYHNTYFLSPKFGNVWRFRDFFYVISPPYMETR